jgi:NAD(P)-dependent dehydrogenase (short-subunit alcohol dehydrogenase family)
MGGSSGVGLTAAQMFLDEGARVAICGRNPQRLQQAQEQLSRHADEDDIFPLAADATVESEVKQAVEKTIDRWGRMDVLVNSAGQSLMKHFLDIRDEEWEQQIRLKYYAIIYAVRAVQPYMAQQGGGRIININATLAKEPEPHMIATAATRAGLLNLSKALAHEFAPQNILVNSVSLGVIRTDQWERRRKAQAPDIDPEAYYQDLAQKRKIPLGRVGEAEEVASAILFLASKGASYISGSTIEVAGGLGKAL